MAVAQHSIFLSRHGESEYMLDDLIGGDSPLTAAGHAYAEQLPRIMLPLLQQDCCGSPLAVPVLTSTLQRTIQTAAYLPFPQQRLAALDEINAGICEHMSYQQVQQTYPAVAEARARDKLGYRYPQGESYIDLVQRLWPVVHQLEQRQGPVVVVAHQAVLRVLMGLLCRKPLQDIPNISIPLHAVMQLSPTATAAAAAGITPYTVTLHKQTELPQQATPAAAPSLHKTTKADLSSSSDGSGSSSSSSSPAADGGPGVLTSAWPMRAWASCTAEAQGVQAAAAVLTGQEA